MLHNTGPYGPNDPPVNVGSSNLPEIAPPMKIAPNFDDFVKMTQQTAHPSSGHFDLQNYVGYAGTSIGNSPQMNIFQSKYFSQDANHYTNSMLYSHSILENVIRNSEDNQKPIDFSNLANMLKPTIEVPSTNIFGKANFLNNSKLEHSAYLQSSEDISENSLDIKKCNLIEYNNIQSPLANTAGSDNDSCGSSNKSGKDNDQFISKKPSKYLKHSENKLETITKCVSDEESLSDNDTHRDFVTETNDCKKYDNDSDSNDDKPLNLVNYIKQEPVDHIDTSSVVIKVEPISSWSDTEHMQPFLKDVNGVSREDSSPSYFVDSVNSVAEATHIVKNGLSSDLSFECPNCSLIFSHPKRFLIHVKWHSFGLINEKRIEEAKEKIACRKQKKEMQDLVKKETTNEVKTDESTNQETFDCKNCDKKFNNKTKLRNHRHKFHPNREHECKVCHKKVLGWFGLQTHMSTHTVDEAGYTCEVCQKRFKHPHSLTKHRDTHKEKTHACSECPKKFGSQTLLKIHMRSHERAQKGRTYRCSYCPKGFYEAYTLQYHERTHRNERPFMCDICNTSYGSNSSLKRHVKVSHSHSQAKPYECDTCRRCFTTELIRDRHAAKEHGTPGQLTYACPHCTSRYLRLKDLKRHMYRIHPKGKNRRKQSESE